MFSFKKIAAINVKDMGAMWSFLSMGITRIGSWNLATFLKPLGCFPVGKVREGPGSCHESVGQLSAKEHLAWSCLSW